MNKLRLAAVVFTGLVAILQLVIWFPQLPDPMPIHFDGAGRPDRMGSRAFLLILNVGLQGVFLLGFPVLARFLGRLPNELINMPQKDYWLDPSRRAATLMFLKGILIWNGIAAGWLMIAIFQLTALVATKALDSVSPAVWMVMAVYLLFVFGSCLYLGVRFYRIPDKLSIPEGRL